MQEGQSFRQLNLDWLFGKRRLGQLDGTLNQVPDIAPFPLWLKLTRFESRTIQKVFDETLEPVERLIDFIREMFLSGREGLVCKLVRRGLNDGKRRAELV